MNVYLPEGIFAVAVAPGAPPEELAEIVLAPVEPRTEVARDESP